MNILWLDVETTGLDPKTSAISQIAAIAPNGSECSIEMKPFDGAEISPKALQVQGITVKQLMTRETQFEGFSRFCKFVTCFDEQPFMIAGYNAGFDKNFIFESMIRLGYRPIQLFSPYVVDVYALTQIYFSDLQSKPCNFQLSTVCAWFKIPLPGAHNALADIRATQTLFTLLRSQWAIRFCPCRKNHSAA